MGKVTFILDTSADTLAAWLLANWRAPHGASETGSLQGQSLRESRQSSGARVLTADVIWVSYRHDEEGAAQAVPLREAFRFRLQPLAAQRVEVTAECLFHYGLLADLARLLEDMARRWPELRDTLEYLPDYWDFDSMLPENEAQQTLLDAFDARLRRLKGRTQKGGGIVGHRLPDWPKSGPQLAITFKLPTTAHHAAIWLQECGNRIHESLTSADGGYLEGLESDQATWRHNTLERVTPRETTQGDGATVLHTVLETYMHGQEATAERTAIVRYVVTERSASSTRISVLAWMIRYQIFAYLGELLARVFADYEGAAATLRYVIYYWPEQELSPWTLKDHQDFVLWLNAIGGQQEDPIEKGWPYSAELFRLKQLARADGPAPSTGPASELASDAARADGPAAKPRKRGRSKPVRQAKIRKLFEEENRRDLTIAQMARWYGVNRKTISRDLSELGYILEDGILKDNSPP